MKLYEQIRADNWVKGVLRNDKGACLMGHLYAKHGIEENGYLISDELKERVRRLNQELSCIHSAIEAMYADRFMDSDGRQGVSIFNDHPDTTFEDVQRVLKVADV